MLTQALPQAASSYSTVQRAEIAAAVSAAARLWGRMGSEFDASYALIEAQLLQVMDTAQERVTVGATAYVPAVLAETAPGEHLDAEYAVPPSTMVGTAGGGVGTDAVAYGAVLRAKHEVAQGWAVGQALAAGGRYLTQSVGTVLSDTGRTVERMASESRGVTTYVRMLTPPSCGRCVILAGRVTRRQDAFLRHPGCDCRNIPASESVAGDLTVDPTAYLDSLDDKELARALGSKANAQAYLDGASQNQLVNAYRRSGGVRTAQDYGRTVKYATEGVTQRGHAYRSMSQMAANQTLDARGRNIITTRRLMPETIYTIAKDRADARRLLKLYGWIY